MKLSALNFQLSASRIQCDASPRPVPDQTAPAWFTIRDEDPEHTEILIYDRIGKGWYEEDGVDAKAFNDALKAIPAERKILVRINSPGGNVSDGLAIYNMLNARRDKVTCRVDGTAASIASVICMAGARIEMSSNCWLMMHDPSALVAGNSEQMRKMADLLDRHADNLANIYAARSGKTPAAIRALMRAETWLNGDDAKKEGFCDEVSANAAAQNCAALDLSNFRHVPEALKNQQPRHTAPNQTPAMNRTQIIALLNKWGLKLEDSMTDAQLVAILEAHKPAPAKVEDTTPAKVEDKTPSPSPADAKLQNIEAEFAKLRRHNVTAEIDRLVENNQLTAAEKPKAIDRALKDESYLEELKARPVVNPGAEPVNAALEVTGNSIQEIQQGVLRNFGGNNLPSPEQARERGANRARIIAAHLDRILPLMNTNTISTDLKRSVILQQMMRAFAVRVMPLSVFSTRLNGFRLEGTNKVVVPYFPLDQTASTDFVTADGYNTFGNSNADAKVVTINKRKYQALNFTSEEVARQPYFNAMMSMGLKAEQLGIDVVNDVLSLVLLATYGAAAKTENASAFDSDDVIDLKGAADTANWPAAGRALLLNSAYDINLLKDKSVKDASAFADNSPIREGRVFRIAGFDYYADARIPANGENLVGFISFPSAILVGFAPVEPTEDVRKQLSRYEVVTEPTTGATLEYRAWGNPDKDESRHVIEANYGYVAGEANALKRITSA